jgi:hypothetical protein
MGGGFLYFYKMEDYRYKIEFKGGGDYLLIAPIEQPYRDSTEPYDRRWIIVDILVKASSFHGGFRANMTTLEFEELKSGLEECNNDFKAIFEFTRMEDPVDLKIRGDGLGNFYDNNVELKFYMVFDQTSLPQMIRDITEITTAFPCDRSHFKL